MNKPEVKYPQTIIQKSDGEYDSEKYLSKLCKNSFLSLWSFPNVYKNDGIKNGNGDGKELCDLLVIFGEHVLIFSDKNWEYPQTENPFVNWSRWFKRSIMKSADQIWMAEKWLMEYPERIFMDKKCKIPFPLSIPKREKAIIHRIAVAHNVSEACKKQLGGSGSLMIVPHIVGDQHIQKNGLDCKPFSVGQIDPEKGYIHVLDDTSLKVVMQTLDTITDFVNYITKKEQFILSNKLGAASGEDDLLAFYLHAINDQNEHDFLVDENTDQIFIDEGFWNDFTKSPQRLRQIEENKISYVWDRLVETFLYHVANGTSHYMSEPNIKSQDIIFRFLAKENRTRRRILGSALIELLQNTPKDKSIVRTIGPSNTGDPYYIIILLPRKTDVDYEKYRTMRLDMLYNYCILTRLRFENAVDIIGIGMETGFDKEPKSEDCIYFDGRSWNEALKKEAEEFQEILKNAGLLAQRKGFKTTVNEYPDKKDKNKSENYSTGRNDPCPCGSGIKFKKCCGRL